MPIGGVGGASRPPIFSNLQESGTKGSHAARELATVFCVTFCLSFNNNSWSTGQNAPPLTVSYKQRRRENSFVGAV